MRDMEAEMAAALNGKFFWEPTTQPNHFVSREVDDIRFAQRKHCLDAVDVVAARSENDKCNTESIKPMTLRLKHKPHLALPIIRAVAAAYDVPMDSLIQKSTSRYYARAKSHLYWAMFRYLPHVSCPEAAKMLDKNHSTVLHGKKLFQKTIDYVKVAEVDVNMGWTGCGS